MPGDTLGRPIVVGEHCVFPTVKEARFAWFLGAADTRPNLPRAVNGRPDTKEDQQIDKWCLALAGIFRYTPRVLCTL